MTQTLSARALQAIKAIETILNDEEWSPDTLDEIKEAMDKNGFHGDTDFSEERSDILRVTGKTSDLCFVEFPNGGESDGYVPEGIGIGGGDYLKFSVDTSTGQIVGWNEEVKSNIEAMQKNL